MHVTILRRWFNCMTIVLIGLALPYIAIAQSDPKTTATGAAAESQSELFYDTDPKSWARVLKIFPPTYPEEALKNGVGGIVDIDLLINTVGRVKDIRTIVSIPNNPAFEQATRDVLRHWVFGVPLTNRCIRHDSFGDARLTFEVKNGEGVITLTHREQPTSKMFPTGKAPKMLTRDDVAAHAKKYYPTTARRVGLEALVDMLLTIDPVTGELIGTEVTNIETPNAGKKMFSEAALASIRYAKFEPFEGRTTPWKKCFAIDYRLSGIDRK